VLEALAARSGQLGVAVGLAPPHCLLEASSGRQPQAVSAHWPAEGAARNQARARVLACVCEQRQGSERAGSPPWQDLLLRSLGRYYGLARQVRVGQGERSLPARNRGTTAPLEP